MHKNKTNFFYLNLCKIIELITKLIELSMNIWNEIQSHTNVVGIRVG